ncbi:hypothetical protein HDU76_006849 [Blyttiomyces sp. JEL0837]|nr:hypothetical protein HDU76_006849 [Blyttiomyces sp. JEL0837]
MAATEASISFPRDALLPPIGFGKNVVSNGATEVLEGTSVQQNADEATSFTGKLTNTEAQRIMNAEQLYLDVVDKFQSGNASSEVELAEATHAVKASTRAVCRYFLHNPSSGSKLRFLKSSKAPPMIHFEQLLQEVKNLVFERLRTSVEEERARQEQLSIIITKEQKTSNEVKALKAELDKAKKERTAEINKRNEVIRRLKEDLREIKQQAEETTKRMESRSKQKEDRELQQAKEKARILESAIKNEINSLQSLLDETIKKDREEEAQLRKKKFKVESEVENWIHKYDQDMEEKQAELEDITAIFLEEKAQLDELQTRFNDLQKEYERIMEERRLAQEMKKEQEKQQRRMHDAATLIQAVFRGYRVRRELQKKKAAAKPDKKKKK